MRHYKLFILAFIVLAPGWTISTLATQYNHPLSGQERIERANTYLDAFRSVSDKIITLSPTEQEWVKKEREAVMDDDGTIPIANFDRWSALSDTREYVIYETRAYLDSITNWVELAREQGKSGAKRTEMAAWSMVIHTLLAPTLAENASKLQKHNVLQQDVLCEALKPVHEMHMDSCYDNLFFGFSFAARRINIQILKPYLFTEADDGGG